MYTRETVNNYLVELLTYKIKENKNDECIKIIDFIAQGGLVSNYNISLKQLIDLLYISIIVNKEKDIVREIEYRESLLNLGIKELDIVNAYLKSSNDAKAVELTNKLIDEYSDKKIDDIIFNKAKEEIKNKLCNLSIVPDNSDSDLEIKNQFSLISNKKTKCPFDNFKLMKSRFKLQSYSDKKYKIEGELFNVEGRECGECGRVYFNEKQVDELEVFIGDNYIKRESFAYKKECTANNIKENSGKIKVANKIDEEIINSKNIISKVDKEQNRKSELIALLKTKINDIYISFENRDIESISKAVKKAIDTQEKTLLLELLPFSYLFKFLEVKDINTILLLAELYGVTNEFINEVTFNAVYKSNSLESKLIKNISIEKRMMEKSSIEVPTKLFIETNINELREFNKKVLKKASNIIEKTFYPIVDRIIVSSKLNGICVKDSKKTTKKVFYLKVQKNKKDIYYYLYDAFYCKNCNSIYILSQHIKGIRKDYGYEIMSKMITEGMVNSNKNPAISNMEKNHNIKKNIGVCKEYKRLLENYKTLNNISLKIDVKSLLETSSKIKSLSRTEFITTILCGLVTGFDNKLLANAIDIYNLGAGYERIFFNRFMANKEWVNYWRENSMKFDMDSSIKSNIFYRLTKNDKWIQPATVTVNNELNDESDLKKLGYSVTLSRVERANILRNRVVPRLGKKKIRRHLEFLINMNKGRSSMSNAVNEWRYDIEKLSSL